MSSQDHSLAMLGGVCSILVGGLLTVVGFSFQLTGLAEASNFEEAWLSHVENASAYFIFHLSLALTGLFGLAVVPAISKPLRLVSEGWIHWTSLLAYIGLAVTALNNLNISHIANAGDILAADPESRRVLELAFDASSSISPLGFGFWSVGVWVLVASLVGLRARVVPIPVALIGVALAVGYFAVETPVSQFAWLGTAILGPIWFIWHGVSLLRSNRS